MAFVTTEYCPFSFLSTTPQPQFHPSLSVAQFSHLRKLYNENEKSEFLLDILPNLDGRNVRIFSKPCMVPLEAELSRSFKAFNDKNCGKKLDLNQIRTNLHEKGIDLDTINNANNLNQNDCQTLYIEIYNYITLTITDLVDAAKNALDIALGGKRLSTILETKACQNDQLFQSIQQTMQQDKNLDKLQQIFAIILLALVPKLFVTQYLWPSKVVKVLVTIGYDGNLIKSCQNEVLAAANKKGHNSKKIKNGVDFCPLFGFICSDHSLSQMASFIAGAESITKATHAIFKTVATAFKQMAAKAEADVEKKDQQQGKDQSGLDQSKTVQTQSQTKAVEAKPMGQTTVTEKPLLQPDQLPMTVSSIELQLEPQLLQVQPSNHHIKYVDANHIWEPTFDDQLFAISNLRSGQVRFGVVQGIEEDLGIFIDTYQNHVKVRCLCPLGQVYDFKTLRTKVESAGGLGAVTTKSTKPMDKTLAFGEEKTLKDQKAKEKAENQNWKHGGDEPKGQHHNTNSKNNNDNGEKREYFSQAICYRFAKKQYQVGDRVSFVITNIQQQKMGNNAKQGARQNQKLPKVFVSFTTNRFRTLATEFATQVTLLFKYLLYVKLIDVRNRYLGGNFLHFYPPRFLEQVSLTPILSHFSSEFNVIDSRLLAMQFDIIQDNYAQEWVKLNKLGVNVPNGKKKTKKDAMSQSDSDGGEVEGDDDNEEENDVDSQSSLADVGQLTGEFGQYSDDDNDDDENNDDDGHNAILKNNFRTDAVLSKFFIPSLKQITSNRNYNNKDGVGTKAFVQLHNHNGFAYTHYHAHPGLHSALFHATSKQSRQTIAATLASREDASQIYLQSLNFAKKLMSLQPFPHHPSLGSDRPHSNSLLSPPMTANWKSHSSFVTENAMNI